MRLALFGILILLFAHPVTADTTNRALQVSPVPGLFVGGVGLFCEAPETMTHLFCSQKTVKQLAVLNLMAMMSLTT